jgi:endonuclease/exonuclease/phosphatase family metal-dependent hydrolase
MRHIIFIILIGMVNASNVRIMTYNVLNYQDDYEREDDYVLIIDFVQPDLIIAQEIVGQSGYSNFKSDVLDIVDPGHWSGAPFTNQSAQQDIALYYKDDIFSFISTSVVYSAQSSGTRDVIEWVMLHESSGIEFNIYGVHLKASSGISNANERLQETTILRDYLNDLPPNSYFIVGGDFNIYSNNSSSEPAFDMLTASSDDNDGQLFDPIDRIGHWHSNSSYADVHTQSTCNHHPAHNGGANGGLDDRFDWLFVSQSLLDASSSMHYVDDTYWAFGNDGNHFNDSINDGNNSSVSDEIADALHDGSDHLPVYMDVWFDDLTYSDQGVMITEIMVNPSSVSDSYGEWFEIMNMTDSTIDIHGWSIKDLGGDEHELLSTQMTIPVLPEEYFVLARNGDQTLNGGINVDYEYDGFSLTNTEDEVILQDISGAIVDEVHYSSGWPFSSGVSMEIHDPLVDNQLSENWFSSTMAYGNGDLGSPGIPFDGTLNIEENSIKPNGFSLISLYPNPFNPEITIQMDNKEQWHMIIEIFDLFGHKIETLINTVTIAGNHKFTWDASGNSSGMYFFKFTIGNTILIRKALFIK